MLERTSTKTPNLPTQTQNTEFATYRADLPQVQSNIRIIKTGNRLGQGHEAIVDKVWVVSERAPEKIIPLAYKKFREGKQKLVPYSDMFDNYNLAKKAGLPVPRTFRATDNEDGILMTDLSEGGENVVVSRNNVGLNSIKKLYKEHPEIMQQFAKAEDLMSDLTAEKIKRLAERASNANLILYTDTLFIVITSDGSYDFVLGDFTYIETQKDPEINTNKLVGENLYNINNFIRKASWIQKFATDPKSVAEEAYYYD